EKLGNAHGGEQQRDGQWQQPDAGRDRRKPERRGQEQWHGEEKAGLQEVLEEKRREPAAEGAVPQHRRIKQGGVARAPPGESPPTQTPEAPPRHRASARSPVTTPATWEHRAWTGRNPTSP